MAQAALNNLEAAGIPRPMASDGTPTPIPNTADTGYFSAKAVAGLEQLGMDPYVAVERQKHHVAAVTSATTAPAPDKLRRAQILLKAYADGSNCTYQQIAEAFGCRTKSVENIRQRLVERGFGEALDRSKRETPPVEKLLSGEQEARIIATRLRSPPPSYANCTLRLLAREVVELGIVESVSY